MPRYPLDDAPLITRLGASVALGALAAIVAGLVDRLIGDDDVAIAWMVIFAVLMAAFYFTSSEIRRRRHPPAVDH